MEVLSLVFVFHCTFVRGSGVSVNILASWKPPFSFREPQAAKLLCEVHGRPRARPERDTSTHPRL
eukprot:76020-Rhodomonas_salina.2